ncbi:hypothetical protein B0H10DRAFT_2070994 [Mycena sp. CBHHK59/15]|nr:hypothetical protein B0H10DRAFT_2092995 [Mycena sp. CBHHK59/15]KAJ6607660.1 hypothetical protein B0H10DRAFT_2070994 [Mycena sp. CBHHK59/15]
MPTPSNLGAEVAKPPSSTELCDTSTAPSRRAEEIWLMGVRLPGWGVEDEEYMAAFAADKASSSRTPTHNSHHGNQLGPKRRSTSKSPLFMRRCGARTARSSSPSANCRPSHPSRLLCRSPAHIRLTLHPIAHSGRWRRVQRARSSRPRPRCSTARARATRARTVVGPVVGASDTRRRIRRRGAMRARRRVVVMRAIIIRMQARIRLPPRRNGGPSATPAPRAGARTRGGNVC